MNSYGWLGYLAQQMGNIKEALEYTHKSLKLIEKSGKTKEIATLLNNIGYIYSEQKDYKQALSYYNKGLKEQISIKDTHGIAISYNNLGLIFEKQKNTEKALEYYRKSLVLRKDINDKKGIANCYRNIGAIHRKYENYDSALIYFEKSLVLDIESHNKPGETIDYFQIAVINLKKNDIDNALLNANKSYEISKELKFPDEISISSKLLSDIYEKQGKSKLAIEMFKLHIQMRDSIHNESTQKTTAQQQAKYEYEKQKAVDDAEHEKQIALEQESKKKQTILTYSSAGGLGLVGIFLLIVFNRLKVTRKQKDIIEKQKTEVENQKNIVERAHIELEEKNKEITDSIQYAKRIQNAILPPNKVVKEYLQESFILYKPKDIVAGDFYWMETVVSSRHSELDSESPNKKITGKASNDDIVLFAAADCTGHGVPGAMVSVVCNNGLNRSVREYGLTDPGKILDKTREIVIQEFEKSEEDVKDGMDIALCSLKLTSREGLGGVLKYAGAHNPLWIIRSTRHSALDTESPNEQIGGQARNDDYELLEIKANKQPIGQFDNPAPYTTHSIELQKGDSIYIFSDGYADQFGGDKGKKLKTVNFKQLLLSVQKESMEKQKQLIDEAFENWKGDLEQLDDVCIIGVRI